ncbi:MAG TPA: transglutaminase domain-containing protein [Candidatus Limnocylindrales bacterium]|nr:transglutaminase domain-containing protein [Candidatus Limnocylindrales bacterium]
MRRRIPLAPAEGWVTLGLVLLICLTMAWALDDARWVLGRAKYLDYLVVAAIGGVLVGFIGPKVGWGRWLTYLIGSIVAALILPLITTFAALPAGETVPSIHNLFQATSDAVVNAYLDIAYRGLPSTIEYLHWIWLFGLLVWATSMFASYAVFGHRRPMNAVIVVGIVLVANMAVTPNDELWFLVLYSLASLFLLIRSHVFDEQSEWLRRRIGDPSSISSVYLRGGTIFIGVAVAGSVLLTQTAASAPLAGAFDGMQDSLIDVSRAVSRFLPAGGQTRAIGLTFGGSTQVQTVWNTDNATALTIHRDPTDKAHYYWRAWTYDQIGLKGWSASASTTVDRPAGSSILDKLPDDPDPTGLHPFTFEVQPVGFHGPTIFSPGTPTEVEEDSRLTTVGPGYFASLERDDGNGSYRVTALTQVDGEKPGELNEAALEAAGTAYPQAIKDLYLGVADGQLGDNAKKLLARVKAEAKSQAPYDLAKAIVTDLHDPSNFKYVTNVQDLDCAAISTVECFATYKKGFCQYYAPTMAILLRAMGVPTRMVEGFLPGAVDAHTGIETIPFSSAHAWVEVYFPGYGWVMFDPTGGDLSQVAPLPSGKPVASGPNSTLGLPPASRKPDLDQPTDRRGAPIGPISVGRGGPLGPLLAVGALLLIMVGLLAFVAWQRGPRGPISPEGAYGTVTRIASRFGFGPRPAQTVYEYAGALSEILPDSRPELEMVARAKVESVYAHQLLGEDRIAALKAAQRHLRVSLLRLAFLRKERRRRR